VLDVEFHPHAEGAIRESLFRSASAFVLPTHSENFGNVVAEALIRGLPVITTTGTPWSELIPKGCGWYVEPNVGGLMNALAEATAMDQDTLREMGARGRDYAMSHFTLTVVRSALLEMYRTAMHV
jgi:glycosyltransferase involved in cell wall biosynthesis